RANRPSADAGRALARTRRHSEVRLRRVPRSARRRRRKRSRRSVAQEHRQPHVSRRPAPEHARQYGSLDSRAAERRARHRHAEPECCRGGCARYCCVSVHASPMRTFALTFALLCAGACSPGISQREHPQPPPSEASQAETLPSQDREFLERASRGSNAEVAMGAITTTHAMRPQIIAFGQMMVRDHSAANAKLAAVAALKKI